MSHPRRPLAALIAFVVALIWLPLLASSAAADPVVTPDTTINGCNGVLPTPGSENTHKRLDPTFPSDFNPGGVIGYIVDFPVTAGDVGGDFVITDCVYVDPPGAGGDVPIAKYFVSFVPNNTDFHLQFAVPIPPDTPLGSQFCNYVKTTASPSASQASNRKAGPACFTVGGGLRIEKRSGSATGPLLPGASFSVVCTPTTDQPPTIITGLSNQSHTNADGTVSATGVADDGTIAVNGPSGTPCTVTETAAPAGYQVDSTPRHLTIPVGTDQTVNVFVNQQLGSLTVTKHAVGGGGTFHFTVSCDDGHTYPGFDLTVAAGATGSHEVSSAIVTGTHCTVTETANALFSTTSAPANGTVTIDADGETVAFTNTRKTGSLVVTKATDEDGTFHFDVDCDGTAYDTTLDITTSNGTGSARIDGIPTGTACTVTEQANALFSSFVDPAGGGVTIATGDNTVAFTNTRLTGRLVVTKHADMAGTFHFTVDCDGTAYDAAFDITVDGSNTVAHDVTGIPTGTSCTAAETADAHWTTTVAPASGTVTIATGDNTVAFTNTRKTGALAVTKVADLDGTFHFTVDCDGTAYDTAFDVTTDNGTGAHTVSGIPTGTSCTVAEGADAHWTVTVTPADGTVTIGTGDNTVAFTNTRVRGTLTIAKTTDVDATFTFDVDCDGSAYDAENVSITTAAGTGSATRTGIPTGTSCTVTEDAAPLYDTTVSPADGTVTIDADGETVAFTNLRKRGSLVVTKGIVDDTASGPYAFTFHVDCTTTEVPDFQLGTAEGLTLTRTISGIQTGETCTVTEDADATWSSEVTPAGGTATIGDTPVTVAFTNTKLYTALSLTKASDPVTGSAVTDGDTITYFLTYANDGNTGADVTITDAVPAGTTYVAGSAGDGTLDAGTLTWTRSVAAKATGVVSFQVTVNAGLTDPFTVDNVAVLHSGDTDTPSNETHHPVAHVAITKAVDKDEAKYGDALTYTLHVTNPGAATLTGVTVTDAVPDGTTFASASGGGTCDDPCATVTWPLADLAPGASADVTFTVTIDTPAAAADGAIPSRVVLNSAVAGTNETPDEPSNQVRTVVTKVLGVKIVKPPELPHTGATFPVPQSVAAALALLLAGAGLTFGARWTGIPSEGETAE